MSATGCCLVLVGRDARQREERDREGARQRHGQREREGEGGRGHKQRRRESRGHQGPFSDDPDV